MRDDVGRDPVVRGVLAAMGHDTSTINWVEESVSFEDGHRVMRFDHAGWPTIMLRLHEDEQADWFASIEWVGFTYYAQRGRRSIAVREQLPDTVADGLVDRTAEVIADVPGFAQLHIVGLRPSSGDIGVLVVPTS